MTPVYRVDLVVQVGTGTPAPFPTSGPAPTPMHAWAEALRKLRRHAQLQGWDPDDYQVLSYTRFHKITNPEES
jgi:hypothetical protein